MRRAPGGSLGANEPRPKGSPKETSHGPAHAIAPLSSRDRHRKTLRLQGHRRDSYILTEGSDEIRLSWRTLWRPVGRIEIAGQLPRWGDDNDQTLDLPKKPVITVRDTSSAEHAEYQIRQRLFPLYLSQLEYAKSLRSEWNERLAKQEHTVQALEAVGALRSPRRRGLLELPFADTHEQRFPRGNITVCEFAGDIDLELRNLSLDEAMAVIRALGLSKSG